MKSLMGCVLVLLAVSGVTGCAIRNENVTATFPSLPDNEIVLPQPRLRSEVSLEEALAQRRSVRQFTEEPLSLEEISQLLWSAQGITRDWGGRTVPSAGALYPLELYLATGDEFCHYVPEGHRLAIVSDVDLREDIWGAGLKQDAIRQAPAVFVIAAVYGRTEAKYGDRASRYVHLEAGHAAQGLLLQATALGLGGVPIGAFYDQQLQVALALPEDQEPLYLIPVGHPAE